MLVPVIYLILFAVVTTSADDRSTPKGCIDVLHDDCNICAKWKKEGRCEEDYAKMFCTKTCDHCPPDSEKRSISYLGCYDHNAFQQEAMFQRDFKKILPIERRELSVKHCMEECATNGFPYAGLQAGEFCLCSSEYGKYGKKVDDEECSLQCPADSAEKKCGGSWKNAVYEIKKRQNIEDPELSMDKVEKILIHSTIAHNKARLRPQAPVEYPLQPENLLNKQKYRRYQY